MSITARLIFSVTLIMWVFALSSANADYFRFKTLKLSDGLPSMHVNATFQQSNGFIWFATDSGASRYDGNHFRHYFYAPGQDNHITNNYVTQIFEDAEGNIWIVTEDGLNRLNVDGSMKYFRNNPKDPRFIEL